MICPMKMHFCLLWPWNKRPKLSMSIFVLVLTRLSEIYKKIPKSFDILDENVDFGHFMPFLACFWPIMAPVSVSKALKEYIWPISDWIEWN